MSGDADLPDPSDGALMHARALYWRELVQLKVDCEYTQRYRDHIESLITRLAIGRAIVSVGALGSWFAGIGQARLWGGIIVVSQVAEAIFAVLPLRARARALHSLVVALDAAFVDTQFEWEEEVQSNSVKANDVRRRWHKLMRTRHEAEIASLGNVSLPKRPDLLKLAEEAANTYFTAYRGATRL